MAISLENRWFMGAIFALLASGCTDPPTQCRPAAAQCAIGAEGCRCTAGGACDAGLACTRGVCEAPRELPCTTSSTGDPGATGDSAAEADTDAEAPLPDCVAPLYWGR